MDSHFSAMLDIKGQRQQPYIAAASFSGAKVGYYFGKGDQGLGYYVDTKSGGLTADDPETIPAVGQKRKYGAAAEDELDENDPADIDAYIAQAEQNNEVEALTAETLQQALLSFEKKITKNQKMRMKYVDQPDKFMESEVELHEQLCALYSVAASPELYPILVDLNAVSSVLGMIAHENTDISLAAVGLIQELTDPELFTDGEEEATVLIDAFLKAQGLELVVQNISRLDEANEDDAQGVYNSLAVIENLVEIRPDIAILVCEKTNILQFLLLRLKEKAFDANKFYCAEILSILTQADVLNQRRLCSMPDMDGMDTLLQAINQYRKRDPQSVEEEECIQDTFLSLCTVLMLRENQNRFRAAEGFELMVRCVKERKFAAISAVKVINFAISGNLENCERLIDAGGLKYLFPQLMGRNLPKVEKKDKKSEKRTMTEAVLSIVCQLCHMVPQSKNAMYATRLTGKLAEEEYEKLQRCCELFLHYTEVLDGTERDIVESSLRRDINRERGLVAEDDEELDYDSEEMRYSKRLEGGLFSLQQLASIIAFACVADHSCVKRAQATLAGAEQSLVNVQAVLREAAAAVSVEGAEEETGSDEAVAAETLRRTRQRYIEWGAAVGALAAEAAQ